MKNLSIKKVVHRTLRERMHTAMAAKQLLAKGKTLVEVSIQLRIEGSYLKDEVKLLDSGKFSALTERQLE